ncbi:Uncharacterized protein GBIM_19595 [Gryllus bimaculatus]|nr:Uncharacterized protein GBIM_19595 [Gryllus bimaculatus]
MTAGREKRRLNVLEYHNIQSAIRPHEHDLPEPLLPEKYTQQSDVDEDCEREKPSHSSLSHDQLSCILSWTPSPTTAVLEVTNLESDSIRTFFKWNEGGAPGAGGLVGGAAPPPGDRGAPAAACLPASRRRALHTSHAPIRVCDPPPIPRPATPGRPQLHPCPPRLAPHSFFPAAPAPATTRAPVAKAIPAPPPLLVADEPRPLTVDRRPAAKALPVATRFESDSDKHLREKDQQELFRKQAESAHYAFDSSVDDGIMGHSHVRQEVRDGLKLSGAYSYSDGFYRRTVHYEADENGYRVIKQESEPIGDGPELDLHGTAKVSSNVAGVTNQYVITADDISELHEKH